MHSIFRSLPFALSSERSQIVVSILKTALPIFVTLESLALIGAVDLEISGRISTAAQAAVGLGDQLLYFTSTAASGLSVGTCAVLARYFGAGNAKRILSTIKASLMVATICGAAAMIAGWLAAENFVKLLSDDASVIILGTRYIQLCALGSLPYVLSIVLTAVFRSLGKTAESLYSSLTTMFTAIVLSYFLFEIGPWKGTLEALCIAWITAAYLGLAISLLILKKHLKTILMMSLANQPQKTSTYQTRRNSIRLIKLLFVIGTAVVLAESSTLGTDFLVYKLLSMLEGATDLQAAWTIFLKVEETFAIMPITALSLSFAATVGQMIGAGKEKQARDCLQFLVITTTIVSAILGTFLVAAPSVMASFTHLSGEALTNTGQLVTLLPLFLPLLTVRLLTFSFMEGAGQTGTPMKIALSGNSLKLILASVLMNIMSFGFSGLVIAILLSRTFMAVSSLMALKTAKHQNAALKPAASIS